MGRRRVKWMGSYRSGVSNPHPVGCVYYTINICVWCNPLFDLLALSLRLELNRFHRDGAAALNTPLPAWRRYPFRPTPTGYSGKSKHGTPGPWLTCNNSLPVRRHPLHGLATITRLVDHAPWTRCAVSCPSHERSLYALRNQIKALRDPSLGLRRPVWLQVISLARCP